MAFDRGWLGAELPQRPRIESYITLLEAYALSTAAKGAACVLEVGSAWGYSSIVMAQAGAEVVACDPHLDFDSWDRFNANVRRAGLEERIHPVRKFSQEFLPRVPDGSVDLMFIDGDHGEEVASFDCRQALRIVRPGGIIAVHDYSPRWGGVLIAVRRELKNLSAHWLIETLYLAVK